MGVRGFKVDVLWLVALGASAVFAYLLATQNWLPAIGLAGSFALLLLGLSRPLLVVVIWVIGQPTIFIFANNQLESLPGVTVERALFLFLAALLVARLILKPEDFKRPGAVEKAMGAYLLIILASWLSTLADKPAQTVRSDVYLLVQGFLMPFTAYVIARNVGWTPRLIQGFLWALLTVGLFQAVAGVLQHFFGYQLVIPVSISLEHPDRMTGTFGNSLPFGIIQSIVFFMTLLLFAHTPDPVKRSLLAVVALVMLACILFAKGRAVWLAIICCMIWVTLRCPRIRPLVIGTVVVGTLALLALVPVLVDFDGFGSRLKDSAPIYNRIALYATALNMIWTRPWLGFGFGSNTFNVNKTRYFDSFGSVPADYASWPAVPHNEILHVLVLMGVVGGVAYLALMLVAVRQLIVHGNRFRNSEPFYGDLADFVLACYAVVLINQMFMDLMFNTFIVLLIFFLLGIVGSRSLEAERAPP